MNQLDLQNLADERIQDAQALLNAARWSAAHYLLGYAVECALKSCILARLTKEAGIIFEEKGKRFSENCWTHKLDKLMELAALEIEAESAVDPELARNWLILKDWNEATRYEQKSESEALQLFDAVTNQTGGVLPWIKKHW